MENVNYCIGRRDVSGIRRGSSPPVHLNVRRLCDGASPSFWGRKRDSSVCARVRVRVNGPRWFPCGTPQTFNMTTESVCCDQIPERVHREIVLVHAHQSRGIFYTARCVHTHTLRHAQGERQRHLQVSHTLQLLHVGPQS